MPPLLQLTVFGLALIFSSVLAEPYKALVAPITKDISTSLYSISFSYKENYVIDLGLPFSWHHCQEGHPIITCLSPECSLARSYLSPSCPPPVKNTTGHNQCRCAITPYNPISHRCASSQLTYNNLSVSQTDGHGPILKTAMAFPNLLVSCAPKWLLRSLPTGSSGMASLSQAPLSLPTQFSSRLKNQFAICLPSTGSAPGVVFFGEEPFYLLPPPGIDVTRILSFTPLLKHPTNRNRDYYIGLKQISVNGKTCEFLQRMLEFDALGHGGVKLSTIVPYTMLRSHIYRSFIKHFAWATRGIPRARKVKPFDLCLNTTKLGSTRVGLPVPQIDLELSNGKNWTIFGANSMKQVSDEVACLAFVDGGERAEQAVLIGSFQMEDNLLLFDLVGSRLGFSSSLFFIRTTCANFNFTSGN